MLDKLWGMRPKKGEGMPEENVNVGMLGFDPDVPSLPTCACGALTLPWFDWRNWKEGDPAPSEVIEFDNVTHSYTGCEIHRPM